MEHGSIMEFHGSMFWSLVLPLAAWSGVYGLTFTKNGRMARTIRTILNWRNIAISLIDRIVSVIPQTSALRPSLIPAHDVPQTVLSGTHKIVRTGLLKRDLRARPSWGILERRRMAASHPQSSLIAGHFWQGETNFWTKSRKRPWESPDRGAPRTKQ